MALLEIREAVTADAPALVPLLDELGYPAPPEVIAARLQALMAAREVVLLALVEGEVVGCLALHVTPVLHRPTGVGRITALVVTPRARGHGVGRDLVAEAERRLTAQGCALVEVTSNQKRLDAHEFYRRLGYEATSVRFARSLP
jgi:N-acetylglutamate synthase-like GNAT family acetyltransferase